MGAPSFLEGRTVAVCPACGKRYASNDGWSWVCFGCGPDATAQALVDVATALAAATAPVVAYRICTADGCLLMPGETCPACRARDRDLGGHYRRYHYTETEHDPKRPVAWRPNGRGIQVPVYEQSEVA
jgi:hypothetical protein